MPDQAGDKTQEATPHRRQQAREQGQVAFSQDLGSAVLLIAGALLLMFFGRQVADAMAHLMTQQLSATWPLTVDRSQVVQQARQLASGVGAALLPILGLLLVCAIVSTLFQVGFLFVPQRLKPDLQRLSPLSGIRRIVSMQGVMRLSFGLFKVAVVSITAGAVIYQYRSELIHASEMAVVDLAKFLTSLSLSTALWVGAALFVLALFDYAFQRWKHEQDLRMTNQEVREEMKNLQGDPQIIARRRAIQRQMALNRVGDKVPKADFVVTNPTELAVAVQYAPEEMAAPIVVAKGAGVLAQRIRRLALEHGVPVIERKPLAQLLYRTVEVGNPIPDESYAAVAEVLAYVYQLKGKKFEMPSRAA